MSQFDYTLPSGANFVMQAPAGTTQAQADFIFYSQVAAGSLVGFIPGQSISAASSAAVKFELSRLDRGTAGVDDVVILSIINGLPSTAGIPTLVNVPLQSPITQANIAAIAGTGFTAPAIGSLTSNQTLALMAQVANTVDQDADTITNDVGVGRYGFSCQQLEMAGYVKPGTWQQFIQNGSGTLVEVLSAPGIWTGLDGIDSLTEFLNNINAQNKAQASLMQNGFNSLQAVGVINTPVTQSVSAVRGRVFTGSAQPLTATTTTVTNEINGQIGALVANSSKYGTQLTAQWATSAQNDRVGRTLTTNQSTSNLASIAGIGIGLISKIPNLGNLFSGTTSGLPSFKTAMDVLGKASQFASTAASTLTSSLGNLGNLNIGSLTSGLPSLNSLTANLPNVSALTGQIQGQATALVGQIQGQATALLDQAQAQANALLAQAEEQFNSLIAQGDSLVSNVQKAAGFSNTVNRATVDVAMTKIFGSSKIPVPGLGTNLPDSASIGAALDIAKAENILKNFQGQGNALLNQAQGQVSGLVSQAQGQVSGLASQVQGQAGAILAQARNTVNIV
jgi:hypothetical protein